MPTINTSVAKKENPSINQRKGQIELVFDGEIRKRVNFLRLFIHQIGSSANHSSAQNQSIPHVCCYPSLLFMVRPIIFISDHFIQAHTVHIGTVVGCLTTIHVNRKNACANNHDILLPCLHYAMKH